MFSKSCIYIGLLIRQLRNHCSLNEEDFINKVNLHLTPDFLSKVESGLLDLHIDEFIKIMRHFSLDLSKVFDFINSCHKNNCFNKVNIHCLKSLNS